MDAGREQEVFVVALGAGIGVEMVRMDTHAQVLEEILGHGLSGSMGCRW